jgi:hypothetical protein
MRHLVIIPRWAGTSASDFYPWLEGTLLARQPPPFERVTALDMPCPQTPDVQRWPKAVGDAIGDDLLALRELVLLGHSVGCLSVLHALARLPEGVTIAGAVLVAGWFTVDQPWDTLRPWMDVPIDYAAARRACRRMIVLLSDNDPFTADHDTNRRLWNERLGAEVRLAPGAKHFNATEEPAVLSALLEPFP